MLVFTIIIFGLATLRTITRLALDAKDDTQSTISFINNLLIAGTMIWCYVWFLIQFIEFK